MLLPATPILRFPFSLSTVISRFAHFHVEHVRLHHTRQAKNFDLERHVAEIRVRAEHRCGQLLAEVPKAEGAAGNPGGQGAKIVPSEDTRTQTLADLGITYDQSAEWQKLADMPAMPAMPA